MDVALGIFAAATFALLAKGAAGAALGRRRLARLADVDASCAGTLPSVSVVVAARDEAATIEAGLASLLAQDLEGLEVVVVDDRSTDGTGAAVARLAGRDPRVTALRIDELPEGWLGKNHALARGAAAATGEWLLFTDADVVFAPGTVRAALAHARERGAAHVTAAPGVRARGWPLALFVGTFAMLLGLFTKPWRAADPRSRAFIGIGALNLVRRAEYEEAGGHAAIALRVDDDLRLGELMKRHGHHQELLLGGDALTVEWYPSFGAMVRGLEKNAFAGLEYRVSLVAVVSAMLLALFVAPPALLAGRLAAGEAPPATVALLALSTALAAVVHARAAADARVAVWPALLAPLGVLVFVLTLWRSTWLTLRRGGVRWRGTLYPLATLRAAARGARSASLPRR